MAQLNNTDTLHPQEQEFQNVQDIIYRHRSKALREVNNENVISAWEVGCFISARLKTAAWGSKTVTQLAEFLRRNDPTLRGFGRRNLYNMVEFFECYTSQEFLACLKRWPMLDKRQEVKGEIVQPVDAQFEEVDLQIVQTPSAQLVHSVNAQLQRSDNQPKAFVQSLNAQISIPKFLLDISLTNHVIIFNNCRTMEAKIFYCLYSARERLTTRALQRAISADTMSSLLGDGHNLSKGLKKLYPQANVMLKDTLMVDFLGLPKRHNEPRLHKSIVEHGREFMAELGSDFIFMGSEFPLEVGGSTFRIDLLYFHRGLQCLVAVELKSKPFKPEYMGQLEFYLEALDRDVRRSNENPSIGMLICQESNRMVVEYAMSRALSPTMVAEYQRALTPKETVQRSLDEFVGFVEKSKK